MLKDRKSHLAVNRCVHVSGKLPCETRDLRYFGGFNRVQDVTLVTEDANDICKQGGIV
jgi:hypothetical protein